MLFLCGFNSDSSSLEKLICFVNGKAHATHGSLVE